MRLYTRWLNLSQNRLLDVTNLRLFFCATGAVLIISTGKIPTKEVYQAWAQYWLSAGCIQHPNRGYQPTWKSR